MLLTEKLPEIAGNDEACKYNGYCGNELDEDVQGRTGCILERVADCVADNSGLMAWAALTAVVASLNVLLGIVPGAAGI